MQDYRPRQKVSHLLACVFLSKTVLLFFVSILLHVNISVAAAPTSVEDENKLLQNLQELGLSQYETSLESCTQTLALTLQKPFGTDTEAYFSFCSKLFEGLISKASQSTQRVSARQKIRLLEASVRGRDLISLLFKKAAKVSTFSFLHTVKNST